MAGPAAQSARSGSVTQRAGTTVGWCLRHDDGTVKGCRKVIAAQSVSSKGATLRVDHPSEDELKRVCMAEAASEILGMSPRHAEEPPRCG